MRSGPRHVENSRIWFHARHGRAIVRGPSRSFKNAEALTVAIDFLVLMEVDLLDCDDVDFRETDRPLAFAGLVAVDALNSFFGQRILWTSPRPRPSRPISRGARSTPL